jgi:serine/threonine protein kinase
MALSRGTQIGSCEILDLVGSGGMGEVYRGRDTKLGRDVAVKALPDEFAHDATRLARFEREAQALAALNHPHIAIIHDLKEVHGTRYLIMELVEGETLAERIARGAVSIEDALNLASQIADALEAAHEKGVVHRDLKPANIKITPEGRVKVLDFGLAKIAEPSPGASRHPLPEGEGFANSPTLSALQTAGGVILGTAAYMSPEQARGKTVDRRADIWAFGCVLFEMLTGRQTFSSGETVSDTLAGILARDPDWSALPPGIPTKVRALLERCLRKDPDRRLRDIGDARVEIEEARSESQVRPSGPGYGKRRERVLAALALAFFLTTIAGGVRLFSSSAGGDVSAVWLETVRPLQTHSIFGSYRLSPNGRKLAFITGPAPFLIWVRALDAPSAQWVANTDSIAGNDSIFWSPDSEYIAFVTGDGKLMKVPAAGGAAQELSRVPPGAIYDGTWSAAGVILLASDVPGPVLRVPEGGGEPKPATELDASRKEQAHMYPDFLPDGEHFLYLATSAESRNRMVVVGALNSKERQPLEAITGQAKYANGHIVFVRDGALMAQPFDADRLKLTGRAFALANPITPVTQLSAIFSVSTTGTLFYRVANSSQRDFFPLGGRGDGGGATQLFWFDRKGGRGSAAGSDGEYIGPELSPDGKFVAFSRGTPRGISVLEMETGNVFPVTSGKSDDLNPRWSPDRKTIAFQSSRDGGTNLYVREVGMVGEDRLIFKSSSAITLSDWSPDGKYLIYTADNDIWALPYSGDPKAGEMKPRQVTQTPEVEAAARVSWDGRWIAFTVIGSGDPEVWIQSFPEPGLKRKVSINGGVSPRWNRNNRELFYYTPRTPTVMSVALKAAGSSLTTDAPVAVVSRNGPGPRVFGVSPDGRFLLQIAGAAAGGGGRGTEPFTVIQNWPAAFAR